MIMWTFCMEKYLFFVKNEAELKWKNLNTFFWWIVQEYISTGFKFFFGSMNLLYLLVCLFSNFYFYCQNKWIYCYLSDNVIQKNLSILDFRKIFPILSKSMYHFTGGIWIEKVHQNRHILYQKQHSHFYRVGIWII